MITTTQTMLLGLLLAGTMMLASGEDDESVLKVVPANQAVEPGTDITFQCIHYPEDADADIKLQWFMPGYTEPISKLLQNETFINRTHITATNETLAPESRYSVSNGSLTIKNVTFDDAMTFVCKSPDGELTQDTVLKVYVMPSYFTEGMIVVGINIGLIGVFILCSIWSFIKGRKERLANQESRRKSKLGHREMAKRAISE